VELPSDLKKFTHSFLLPKAECQAEADSAVINTATAPIIPAAATTAIIAITVFSWSILKIITLYTSYIYLRKIVEFLAYRG
jgi:hypothetical protein